jgi:hypothetical protein
MTGEGTAIDFPSLVITMDRPSLCHCN